MYYKSMDPTELFNVRTGGHTITGSIQEFWELTNVATPRCSKAGVTKDQIEGTRCLSAVMPT